MVRIGAIIKKVYRLFSHLLLAHNSQQGVTPAVYEWKVTWVLLEGSNT